MNVLVLNCGSSSVKFRIIETDAERMRDDADRELCRGLVERIGGEAAITFRTEGREPIRREASIGDHREAIDTILGWIASGESGIESIASPSDVDGVGHRVVHGGESFKTSVRIDARVLAGIEDCIELAPLHNPANLEGIRAVEQLLGAGVPQVAVFDTAFHATIPEAGFLYGIPYAHYRRHRIRRYGFHGTSHRYVSYRYRRMAGIERDGVDVITLHLGHGCSACAIRGGESVDTSMGFTPLEGLLMATRSGDVDASIVDYLTRKEGLSSREVDAMLNQRSGLLGISGITGDMRELLDHAGAGNRRAELAVELFCRRARKYVGAYLAVLGGANAVIFTGGIGENSAAIRERICRGLDCLGLVLDPASNAGLGAGAAGRISEPEAPLEAWVIPTNEELLIARDTYRVVAGTG